MSAGINQPLNNVQNMLALATSFVKSMDFDKIVKHGKELANILDERIDGILDALVAFNRESSSALCGLSERSAAVGQIITAVEGAFVFVGSIDDLLYYGRETDFESIKNDIKDGRSEKLNWFLHKMNEWLENTEQSYEDFASKCNTASKYFTDVAENFDSLQAQERASKKKVRLVGGTASTAVFSGAIGTAAVTASAVAGFLTLGVGAVVGLGLTAAGLGVTGITTSVATYLSAREHKRTEKSLKAMSKIFKQLAHHGDDLRYKFDDLHATLKRYDQNFEFIRNTERGDQDTLCCALDHVKEMLQAEHSEISKARDTLSTLRRKVITTSKPCTQ